jgi:hypothetical protein
MSGLFGLLATFGEIGCVRAPSAYSLSGRVWPGLVRIHRMASPPSMVKFLQRYQNSHRPVISGIVGCRFNANFLDNPMRRLFDRIQ